MPGRDFGPAPAPTHKEEAVDLKITNGTIVTSSDVYRADLGIKDGRIVSLAKKIKEEAAETINAQGLYILPGGVDVHTHLDMPFGGTISADDFESGTIAAACGGTTSLVDFAIQSKGGSLRSALETWSKKAAGKAVIDYGFHVAVTDLNEAVMAEIPELVAAGITSFKCFLAYKGALMIDDGALFKVFKAARKCGALVMLHAENGDVIDVLIQEALANGQTAPIFHALTRPPELEGEATGRGIRIALMAQAPVYIVHLSCWEALAEVKAARDEGWPVYAETCPQYLLLSQRNYLERGFNGAKYVMSPPLRGKDNWDVLWTGLAAGDLQVVSTDHCPFNFKGQKDMGKHSFAAIPNGAPGIEHRLMLLYHAGVNKKRLTLNRFVELVSTAPAKLFGLYPDKGAIAVGSDADLVLWDPRAAYVITARKQHQRVDYTPYEGFKGKGLPKMVLSRGRVIVRDGRFEGRPGDGRFLKRRPFQPS
ncbi:MAG: dihydropyrimidinase [Thermodesulfobacteriota bacterium]